MPLIFYFFLTCCGAIENQSLISGDFDKKLVEMLKREEDSLQSLRNQITASLNDPFLPQLFIQLAEGLDKKANILYFIQAQKTHDPEQSNHSSSLVEAQKEALQVYKKVLVDFKSFPKTDLVLYRILDLQKRLNQITDFTQTANQLFSRFSDSDFTLKAKILVADFYFEKAEFKKALFFLEPLIEKTKLAYERALARRKAALCYIALSSHQKALKLLEALLLDPELHADAKEEGQSLKRIALIDSILAYTVVHKKDHDPVAYYARLAASQEDYKLVLEKLAMRYVDLKKYALAIDLLRVLTRLLQNPQKILVIYHQILLASPFDQRIFFSVEEMQRCMDCLLKVEHFVDHHENKKLRAFFEINLRQIATSVHEYAKKTHRLSDYQRAAEFYQLYLSFFPGEYQLKMAMNLADSQFSAHDFAAAGQTYLALAQNRYGLSLLKTQVKFLENAILCLHDKLENEKERLGYYEKVRATGFLMQTIQVFFQLIPKKKEDPLLVFLFAKAELEQGFLPQAIQDLYAFIERFSHHRNVSDAVELIIDYYNTKAEYLSLEHWMKKIEALHLSDSRVKQRLAKVKKLAQTKSMEQQVEHIALKTDDLFSEGKSYLKAAMMSKNTTLQSHLLESALQKAKAESDIDTFVQVAEHIASTQSQKAFVVYEDLASQLMLIGDFDRANQAYQKAFQSHKASLEKWVNLKLILRDWEGMAEISPFLFSDLSPSIQQRFLEQAADALCAVRLPEFVIRLLFNSKTSLYFLWKYQDGFSLSQKKALSSLLDQACQKNSRQIFCAQSRFLKMRLPSFLKERLHSLQELEQKGAVFMQFSQQLQSYQGSGDAQMESAVSALLSQAYRQFSQMLKSSSFSSDVQSVIQQKSDESAHMSEEYLSQCQKNAPKGIDCKKAKTADFFRVSLKHSAPLKKVSSDEQLKELQKKMLSGAKAVFDLAHRYYQLGLHHQAIGVATNGIALGEQGLEEVLGCSLKALGYEEEAQFHLKKTLKKACSL